jgi:hypothetical protein
MNECDELVNGRSMRADDLTLLCRLLLQGSLSRETEKRLSEEEMRKSHLHWTNVRASLPCGRDKAI